jgi:ABC-type polysaccharide/polyol phosphate export permease
MRGFAAIEDHFRLWSAFFIRHDTDSKYEAAIKDVVVSLYRAELWLALGWHDIKQRYRRSVIGPFWISIATLIFLAIMTLIYASLFNQNLTEFLPFAATGLVTWGLIAACLTEGARVFIDQSAGIRQVPMPLPVHVFRLIWRQFVIMLHNALVVLLILMLYDRYITLHSFLLFPGLALLLLNLCWVVLLLGMLGARFRDVQMITGCFVPVLFLGTPIFWKQDMLPPDRHWIVDLNPVAQLIEIVRAPMLGTAPSAIVWLTCIAIAVLGWSVTMAAFARYRHRIALWV